MSPAPASIPSKYQTVVIDNSDNKGFLSKSKRFNYELWAVSSRSMFCVLLPRDVRIRAKRGVAARCRNAGIGALGGLQFCLPLPKVARRECGLMTSGNGQC